MKKDNQVATVIGLCAAYFICYLTKLSPSAVMPLIQEELNLSASQIGFISGIYFFSYAIMQFFIGPLCKKFTAPKVIMVGMFLASFGLWIFAGATSFTLLVVGRLLIGLGISPIFIGLIFYFQQCYKGDEYVRAFGVIIIVGNISSICASTPLKFLLSVVNRDVVFSVITFASVAVGIFLAVISYKSNDKGEKSTEEPLFKRITEDFSLIINTPVLTCVLLYWFIESAMLMSYQGLWCIKWSVISFPYNEKLISFSGVSVSIGVILSGKYGEIVRKQASRSIKCYVSGCMSVISIAAVSFVKLLPDNIVSSVISLFLDLVYGFSAGCIVLHAGALAREKTDASRNANIMGVINGFGCFIQQLSQWGTGVGVDFFNKRFSLNTSFVITYIIFGVLTSAIVIYSRKTLVYEGRKEKKI